MTIYRGRTLFLFLGVLCLLFFLAYQLVRIQIIEDPRLSEKAQWQHRVNMRIEPKRGKIYDCTKKVLAMSVPVKSVWADPEHVASPAEAARKLSAVLGLGERCLEEKLSRKKRFVWLARKVDDETAARVDMLSLEGVYLVDENKRFYPNGELLCHVLGFVGIDNEGLEGMELYADAFLRGKPGWRSTVRDRKGREILPFRSQNIPPIDGRDLVLTIDAVIQNIVEVELVRAWREFKAKGGSCIVMRPDTGDILAMANVPLYNPNDLEGSLAENRRNRAITDMLEPGSTFKVITGAAALDRGTVEMDDVFFCENGAFRTHGRILHDHHPYGNLTFLQVIQKSSNIGAAKVGMRMGEAPLHAYIRRFGFGERTGVDLRGEALGIVHPLARWSKLSISRIPMGHEVSVTPLQMLSAVSAIANGGYLMKPRIIDGIVDGAGNVLRSFPPEVRRRVIGGESSRSMVQVMKAVVSEEGTARRAILEGYTAAGKTGTAQKIDENGRYSHSCFFGSFVGFAPADDPAIAIIVVLDEPGPVYYGGVVAAPVFKKVSEKVLSYLGVPQVIPDVEIAAGGVAAGSRI